MDDKTKELYAAIGRGETVQFKSSYREWTDWHSMICVHLSEGSYKWRIKPKFETVSVTVEMPVSSGSSAFQIKFADVFYCYRSCEERNAASDAVRTLLRAGR